MATAKTDSPIYHRAIQARVAAQKAGVEMIEIRFNQRAHIIARQERQSQSVWQSRAGEVFDRYMDLHVLIERPAVSANFDERAGDQIVEEDAPTVCVGGIGKLGRWEYFDA